MISAYAVAFCPSLTSTVPTHEEFPAMLPVNRREFSEQTLASLVTLSLLETLFQRDAWGDEVKPIAARWLADIHQLSLDVKGRQLKQVEWQRKVEELLAQVDLPEFLKFIEFDKLVKDVKFKTQGEVSLRPKFPEVEGLPKSLVYGTQVFALKKGSSVVPHGHDNMVTAFLILGGKFRGRLYDRLENGPDWMIIKPTLDREFTIRETSTISDDKDNVHWFQALTDDAFIFNIHVMSVRPGKTGRVYVDPEGEKLSDGRIRAKRLKSEDAYRRFG
jgi:hypothetical protein